MGVALKNRLRGGLCRAGRRILWCLVVCSINGAAAGAAEAVGGGYQGTLSVGHVRSEGGDCAGALASAGVCRIFFVSDKVVVSDADRESLRLLAESLKKEPKSVVTLIGYGDAVGSYSYDLAVSVRFVTVVAELLRSYGVPLGQIRQRLGVGRLSASACVGDCRQPGRSVVVRVSP